MSGIIYLATLFLCKALDQACSTAKTILVQRNKPVLAGLALGLSNFIYLSITKQVVTSDSMAALIVVSVASGFGCYAAVAFNNRFSKAKTYVNVILSDDKEAMMQLRAFLANNKITNMITNSYTLDWEHTFSITAYAETKEQSKLIDDYFAKSDTKFKRMVEGKKQK